jgi:probable F420-dependent oxidoreductase
VPAHVKRVEAMGFHGLKVPETVHNGFLTAMLAIEHSERLEVMTSILLAFPRSPMVVAYSAWDLQGMSNGRFALGLGTQVKGNIEGRYGVPWTPPVRRLREYLEVLREIWGAFQSGSGVDYQGEDYRIFRLQPRFNPGPIEHPHIPLIIGAVGPAMCRLAGELCDGMISHPSNTAPRYLQETIVPRLEAGAARSGRSLDDFNLYLSNMILTGKNDKEVQAKREQNRYSLGFYFSTPPYWPTLEMFGWEEIGPRLRQMTREGRWDDLPSLITDEMIDTLVPQGTYDEIADVLQEWYGDRIDGLNFPLPEDPADDPLVARVVEQLQAR